MMAILFPCSSTQPLAALPWIDLPDSLDTVTAVAAQIQNIVSMAIAHPIWAVASVLLSIVLLQILADLVKRVLKTSLTFVLKLPLMLSQWLWQKATKTAPPLPASQVEELMLRLDRLQREQNEVVVELKSLLTSARTGADSAPDKTLVSLIAESDAQTKPSQLKDAPVADTQ